MQSKSPMSSPFVRSLLVLLALGCGSPLAAQRALTDRARTWPIDSVLVRLDRDARTNTVPNIGSHLVFDILALPREYGARRDSLLQGLERLALYSDNRTVREMAVSRLAFAGKVNGTSPSVSGIMRRLVRIYRAQPDVGVRSSIRNALPQQAERGAAVALLRQIAIQPDSLRISVDHIGDDRLEALDRLAEMGEEGRRVLQAMHRSGEARSPQARAMLADMARRGFPVSDRRQPRVRQ